MSTVGFGDSCDSGVTREDLSYLLRIGEVIALRWERIHPDRIEIVERFYEGEFDDTKTDAGRRSIPLDSHGILRAVLDATWQRSKYHKPDDLVFTNAKGGPVNWQPAASSSQTHGQEIGITRDRGFSELPHDAFEPDEQCGRPARSDAGQHHSTVDVTQNVYNRTWWEERVEAVSLAAPAFGASLQRASSQPGQCKSFLCKPS
jgi:integrase